MGWGPLLPSWVARGHWCNVRLGPCCLQEVELITRFLPMLMSFVVDDHTFNLDQKLPMDEKAPATYPSVLPQAFTK